MKKRIDFKAIAEAALGRSEVLVSHWLPNGRKEGHEWSCGDLQGNAGHSMKVNLTSGVWADFASDAKGGDLISLYAAIFTGNDQARAAKELGEQLGISGVATSPVAAHTSSSTSTGPSAQAKKRTPWMPMGTAHDNAGAMPVAHIKRGKPEAVWEYRTREGGLIGAVYRFRTSDGGKEVLPCVWAKHEVSGALEWRWMSFAEPRPLYGLHRLTNAIGPDAKPVLVVEGEKCVDAAFGMLKDKFDVVSWPGGGKAVHKADFAPLKGRKVILWPDCDAKHEIENDPNSPLKRAEKQPGVAAMMSVAKVTHELGCQVYLVEIPAPGERADGWDIADFIEEGVSADDLVAWMRERTVKLFDEKTPESISTLEAARADKRQYWGSRLIRGDRGGYRDCKENVTIALEDHPQLKGLVAYNEFSARVEKVRRAPWDKQTGEFKPKEWSIHDDRELSMWTALNCDLLIGSTGTVGEGVELVSQRNKYHPVRDWLESLTWDGFDRNQHWLHELLGVADTTYGRLVGKIWLRQAVNRIINPGSKGDYVLILEGTQGLNKSTALRRLGEAYYSDVTLNLNDKDSLMALAGVWILEIAELDAFNRAESTRIKQFITQTEDRFRPPYGKRMIVQPRQTVFAATTNNYEYHKDPTGNRRFWSVLCTKIDLDLITEWREQMFAQALAEVLAGEPCYPTRDQERNLIMPEQEQREIVDVWHQPIYEWLHKDENCQTNEFSTFDILTGAIKMPADKMDGQRSAATRVGNCMAKLGWAKKHARKGVRRVWVYLRPIDERMPSSASHTSGEDDDPIPF
ncbi:MAG: VapE family protein [Methylovulum sp.]|nr:VapE family protein [Methylovulum sp.]